MFFAILFCLNEFSKSAELYSQQPINRCGSNPGPTKKLSLMTFPSLRFSKTPAYSSWNNLKKPKCFSLQYFKAVSSIKTRNRTLILLLANFAVIIVLGTYYLALISNTILVTQRRNYNYVKYL